MTTIQLRSGQFHSIGEPFTPDINDIAFALSHINRFTGHVGQYSVAQHSVMVSSILPKCFALEGLMHDAHEAYIGDVSAPLKQLLPEYKVLEGWYMTEIRSAFGLPICPHDPYNPAVKAADLIMLVTEAKSFGFDINNEHWPQVEPARMKVKPWSPEHAEKAFLQQFKRLYPRGRI